MEQLETMVSKAGHDLCVLCGKETKYLTNTPISQRYDYVEDAGQLCPTCYTKTYGPEIKGGILG